MKLVPYDKEKLGNVYKRTRNMEILEEFRDGPYDCVRLDGWEHSAANIAQNSLKKSIIRFGYHEIDVITRKGEVYLIKRKLK